MDYLLLFALVFGINLLPAFGPPTWSIIVLYGLNSEIPVPLLVLTGAVAAASGRLVLAYGCRYFSRFFSEKTKTNLAVARAAIERRRHNMIIGLGLFAISPLPSAQLFMAVGLARIPLLGFTAAFFAGRTLSYAFYAFTARRIQETNIGDVIKGSLTSPWGIALQLVMLGMVFALTRIDWAKRLDPDRKKKVP